MIIFYINQLYLHCLTKSKILVSASPFFKNASKVKNAMGEVPNLAKLGLIILN